jgi:hypothetical protein
MPRQNTWVNSDGLVVGFGTHSSDNMVPAVTSEKGAVKTMQMLIVGTQVPSSWTSSTVPPQAAQIKRGSYIQRAKLVVQQVFTSGGAATLSIGTYSPTATTDVAAGLLSAAALTTIDAVGEVSVLAGTLVNGTIAVGATSDSDVIILPIFGTAAFTAGRAVLTVEYVEPDYNLTIAA